MKKLQRAYAVVADIPPTSRPSVEDRLVQAFARHQAGDLQGAAAGYQEVLAEQPTHSDALHLLGVAAHQLGDPYSAVQLIESSLSVNIVNPDAASNLGNARLACGDAEGAEFAYRQALRLNAQHADAQYNLANLLQQMERYEEALEAFDAASVLCPAVPAIYFNRANLLQALERWTEAIADYDRVAALNPQFPSLHTNRGAAFANADRWEEALTAFQAAVEQAPDDANGLHNLGCVLNRLGREKEAAAPLQRAYELQSDNRDTRRQLIRAFLKKDMPKARELAEMATAQADPEAEDWYLTGAVRHAHGQPKLAIEAFEIALALDPDLVLGSHHLASAYSEEGRLDDAVACYEEVLKRIPNQGDIYVNLGLAMKDRGEVTAAIATMREGIARTDDAESHSNLIFTLCYSNELTSDEIYRDSVAWAERHTPVVPPAPPLRPREGRKIRVGYLSADFHNHPAGYLYQALFPLHDRERFEIVVYANQTVGDEVTAEIFASADKWHMVKHHSDEELAQRVRDDEIDIFIDLLGHTNNHRLKAFGLRPAPIQATWIGYFGTTGMRQMDYILCDQYAVPPAEERYYTERPARLPGCMYVFQPPKVDVVVNELPMVKNGYPTFGCFNNTAKITEEVVALWCEVLREIPEARMVLNRWPFSTPSVRERYYAMFEANGIDRARVDIVATKGRKAYFESYHGVDVMLDTFPFGGGTTTSEALWMGVPVVSLPADRLVGHMTETVVRAVGLPEILVTDREGYVAMAKSLVADTDQLAEMRTRLRAQVESSPLCDLPAFTRELESTFEWMLEDTRKRS
jgi:predicted O-linked N-acetylglucosamine transferase (SPINDLY family)